MSARIPAQWIAIVVVISVCAVRKNWIVLFARERARKDMKMTCTSILKRGIDT